MVYTKRYTKRAPYGGRRRTFKRSSHKKPIGSYVTQTYNVSIKDGALPITCMLNCIGQHDRRFANVLKIRSVQLKGSVLNIGNNADTAGIHLVYHQGGDYNSTHYKHDASSTVYYNNTEEEAKKIFISGSKWLLADGTGNKTIMSQSIGLDAVPHGQTEKIFQRFYRFKGNEGLASYNGHETTNIYFPSEGFLVLVLNSSSGKPVAWDLSIKVRYQI